MRFLDDLSPGMKFESATEEITTERIKSFAAEFDPQIFHLDEDRAKDTFFGGLAASGWHTAALAMRMNVAGGLPIAGGIIGSGIDELRWPHPVRPGDMLAVDNEVVEVIPSASRPGTGRVRAQCRVLNQDGVVVMSFIATLVVRG